MNDGIHLDHVVIEIVCTTEWPGEAQAEFLRIVNQIRHSGLRLHLRDLGEVEFPVEVTGWHEASERVRHIFDRGLMPSSDHVLSMEFDVPPTSASVSDPDKLVLVLANAAHDFILCWNIVSPGSISTRGILVSTEGMGFALPTDYSTRSIFEASRWAAEQRWPAMRPLDFEDVWMWLRTLPGFVAGFSAAPATRAVFALSHLLRTGEPAAQMFWALVGLEALYTTGDSGLLAQMRSKMPLVLGEWERSRRVVADLYRVRSKFVHGKLDFSSAQRVYLPDDQPETHRAELLETVNVAIAMLLGSIHALAALNASEFTFALPLPEQELPSA